MELKEPITKVRIHQVNTNRIVVAEVPTVNGKAAIEGDYKIDGVPGTGARIMLDFADSAGSVTGKLLPTGNTVDELNVESVGKIEVLVRGTSTVKKIRSSNGSVTRLARAGLSLNYVLRYVGETALSGLPMFSAASLVRTWLSML